MYSFLLTPGLPGSHTRTIRLVGGQISIRAQCGTLEGILITYQVSIKSGRMSTQAVKEVSVSVKKKTISIIAE